MIKLDELRIFIAVAEAGSFVGAANRMNITPPVVSRSIKNLESRLKTTLFNRTTRNILITNEGQWLLKHAITTVDGLEEIHTHFRDNKAEPEGQLTIDAATPFVLHAIAPIISRFIELYPKIDINLRSNESVSDLIQDKVDVAIRVGELKDSTLKAKKIGYTHRSLYASSNYIKQHGEPKCVDDLADHKCLGFSNPKSLNVWPLKTKTGEWLTIIPYMRTDSGEALKQLSVFHNGIICVSDFTVRQELKRGQLIPVLQDKVEQLPIPISAVYYSERTVVTHIRLFLDFLSEQTNF
ncbi:LysR family transcriptional regulator [Kiloniella sp.]|uniref:LysR family transcriptional regulator n=1 Tax=Kiloniella sp. TaxID=1938587 RepID=UPI003B02927E